MKQRRKRRCRHCGELFQPGRRNLRHQRYCAQPACRKESHAASQRRWLKKPGNHDYFRGPAHGQRVRAWRAAHPGYWRRTGTQRAVALQEDSHVQPIEIQRDSGILVPAMWDRSKSGGSALHWRAMTVLNGGGSGRDKVSHLKGVEPLELVQSARGREAEERKPIAPGLSGQTLVS
jgi:hypothetical protein